MSLVSVTLTDVEKLCNRFFDTLEPVLVLAIHRTIINLQDDDSDGGDDILNSDTDDSKSEEEDV